MSNFLLKSKKPQLDCESNTAPLLADDSEESLECKYEGGGEEGAATLCLLCSMPEVHRSCWPLYVICICICLIMIAVK